jgi:hypothetical protein
MFPIRTFVACDLKRDSALGNGPDLTRCGECERSGPPPRTRLMQAADGRESATVPEGGLCSTGKGRQLPISASWCLHPATVGCESRARHPPVSARLARVRPVPPWPRRSAFPAPQPLLQALHGRARGLSPTGPAGGGARSKPHPTFVYVDMRFFSVAPCRLYGATLD